MAVLLVDGQTLPHQKGGGTHACRKLTKAAAIGWFIGRDNNYVELDPFGCVAHDGVPVAWVWTDAMNQKQLSQYLESRGPFGTHCYFEDEETGWKWEGVAVDDMTPELVRSFASRGYNAWIGHRVELSGRNIDRLRDQIADLIRAAKKLSD